MKHLRVSKEEAKKNIIAVIQKIQYRDSGLKKLGLYDYVESRSFGLGKKVASSNAVLILEAAMNLDMIDCFVMAEIFEEIFQNKELREKLQNQKETGL